MKILINICATNDLLCHEALVLAFALASFDHEIHIALGEYLCQRIMQEQDRFIKMLKSLPLYDIQATYDQNAPWLTDTIKNRICKPDIACQKSNWLEFDNIFHL